MFNEYFDGFSGSDENSIRGLRDSSFRLLDEIRQVLHLVC